MARYKGKEGDVTVGGTSVGERISFDIETSANTADASTMGNDWTDTDALQLSATGSLEVFWDPADAQQTAMIAGATVTCVFFPAGDSSGLESISGDFLVETASKSASVGDLVKTTYSLRNKGTVTTASIA